MKITHISVEGVGKFGARTEVVGLAGGVNILPAGNEAGKSTLFRAVRACLFERHGTVSQHIKALATEGLSLPVSVTLGFEKDGQAYSATKNFLKSPSASLSRGATEIAKGKQADEMLWELLGIAPQGRQVDEAAFGLLWVGQGQSFHAPEPSEAASGALNAAIQAEVGTLVGGERARAVLGRVTAELAPLVTETGRPRAGGPLDKANRHAQELDGELAAAGARLERMEQHFAELDAKRGERSRLDDPAIVHGLRVELDEARKQLQAGEHTASRVARLQAEADLQRARMEAKTREQADLSARAARIDEARRREAETQARLAENAAAGVQMHGRKAEERMKVAELDAAATRDDIEERRLESQMAIMRRGEERASLAARLQALETLAVRAAANERARAGNRATAETSAALDAMERELAMLDVRMQASAARLRVVLGPKGAGKVTLGGAPLLSDLDQAVLESLSIQVGDLATITVAAPALAGDAEGRKSAALRGKIAKLVADAGAADAAALRADRVARAAFELEAETMKAELAARGVKSGAAGAAIAALREEIAEIDARMAALSGGGTSEAALSAENARARLDALRAGREAARSIRSSIEGRIDALNSGLARLASERGGLQGTSGELRNQLAADLARLADADRAGLLARAQDAFVNAREAHETSAAALAAEQRLAASADDLERMRARVARLGEAAENHARRGAELDREIANLEGQVQSAGGDGLGETAAALRDERDLAVRGQARLQARVSALLLLKSTVEDCYAQQRDKLNEPLRRHLRPFLACLFPDAELELGDGFVITGLRRGKSSAENFNVLSGGTQEQVAVLVRLAMGAMLCERGQDVPIILDDSLAWCGDERIEQMFDALTRAGRNQQVIVLTCRRNTFRKLGGTELAIVTSGA